MSNKDCKIVDFSGKNLDEEDIKECVKKLRKLVLEDNKLKKLRTEDEYLLRFLHSTKFSAPLAFKRMQDYCHLLLEHPDWFASVSPLDKKKQIERNDKTLLRERDKAGRAILVQKLGKMDAVNSCPQEQAQLIEMYLEPIMDDPEIQATGLSVIVDMNGYSWRLFRWLTPSNIKTGSRKLDLYPLKEIVLHVVNSSFLLNASIKLVWPFLNEGIKNMLKFHYDNWSSLHEYISPDILPSEYGGTGPDIDFEKLNQLLFVRNSEIEAKLKYNVVNKK